MLGRASPSPTASEDPEVRVLVLLSHSPKMSPYREDTNSVSPQLTTSTWAAARCLVSALREGGGQEARQRQPNVSGSLHQGFHGYVMMQA